MAQRQRERHYRDDDNEHERTGDADQPIKFGRHVERAVKRRYPRPGKRLGDAFVRSDEAPDPWHFRPELAQREQGKAERRGDEGTCTGS